MSDAKCLTFMKISIVWSDCLYLPSPKFMC